MLLTSRLYERREDADRACSEPVDGFLEVSKGNGTINPKPVHSLQLPDVHMGSYKRGDPVLVYLRMSGKVWGAKLGGISRSVKFEMIRKPIRSCFHL